MTLAHCGVCPHCSGHLETTVATDPDWLGAFAADSRCQNCGTGFSSPVGLRLLADPDVVAFLADHGKAVDECRFWEFEFLFDGDAVTVVSESPTRYRFTISAGDEQLELVLDDSVTVREAVRRRSR